MNDGPRTSLHRPFHIQASRPSMKPTPQESDTTTVAVHKSPRTALQWAASFADEESRIRYPVNKLRFSCDAYQYISNAQSMVLVKECQRHKHRPTRLILLTAESRGGSQLLLVVTKFKQKSRISSMSPELFAALYEHETCWNVLWCVLFYVFE